MPGAEVDVPAGEASEAPVPEPAGEGEAPPPNAEMGVGDGAVVLADVGMMQTMPEGTWDIDMFFIPIPLSAIGQISRMWLSAHAPTMVIFPERPGGVLQLFYHPVALYLPIPEGEDPQAFKHEVMYCPVQCRV